ncbi:Protein of unknown function [Gryllus bimaculatus]|nr:Protein of unknown function [Gryllus bimaculatus]
MRRRTRLSGRRAALALVVALVAAVSPVRAVRKCCSGADEVLVARAAAAEMQCAGAAAGPPPACAGAAAVNVWVLGADAAAAATEEATVPPVEQLADRRNNLTAWAAAVGCLPQRKGGTEDGGAGAANVTDSGSGSGSGSGGGSGMAEGAEVLLSAPAPPPEPLWTGGELMWLDVVNGVPEAERVAPWSPPAPPPSAAAPAPAEAKGAVVRVAASGGGAAALRKCCPRGFALSLEKRTCVALARPAQPFPAARTLRVAPRLPGSGGGLVALLVGPAESLDGWYGPSSLACPPDTARTFQVVPHVEVEAVEDASDAGNFSSTSEGSAKA